MCISVCDMIYLFQCLCILVLCRLLASYWHIQVGVGWQLPSPSKILGWAPWVSYGERQGLVVWNMIFVFPYIYWEFLHPNWRLIFFRGAAQTPTRLYKVHRWWCRYTGMVNIIFSMNTPINIHLTAKRLPWYQGLDPVPVWMMIKGPSKPGFDSGLSDMVNILPVLLLRLLLL